MLGKGNKIRRSLVVVSLLLCSCGPGTYTLKENNDYFSGGTDEKFTQGLRLAHSVQESTGRVDSYFQHLFYTPVDKGPSPKAFDHKYAGWAAVGQRNENLTGETFDYNLGIIGPWAFGREVQREFHKLIGQDYPQGWDTQLDNRPAVVLTYEKKYFLHSSSYTASSLVLGSTAGNVFTQLYGKVDLKVGHGLSFDSPVVFPRSSLLPEKLEALYFSMAVVGRGVAYNVFLQGDELPGVVEGRVGITFKYGQYLFQYMTIVQTREYQHEEGGHCFSEITLGIDL